MTPAPRLSLEVEGQFAQPDSINSRGFGAAIWAAWRLTDQLSFIAAASTLISHAGPFSTVGAGARALIDLATIEPFIDVQLVALGPSATTGYNFATRIGGGADVHLTEAFAIGLALRTLTPINASTTSGAPGLELGLRLVLTPALLQ